MEEKFREIFEKSPIGIIFLDKEGKLTDANTSTLKIMGYQSLNDVIGLNIFDDPYINPKKDELLEKGHINIQSPLNFDNIKKSGIYNPTRSGAAFLDLTISVIDSGFLGQIQDITEQKQMQNSLRENEEKFRVALRNSPTAVFQQDLNLCYTWVYQPHSHFSKESLLGYTDWDVLDFKDAEMITEIKKRVLSEKIPLQEEVSIHVNEKKFYYMLSLEPLFDIKGNLIGLSGASTDITERKKDEERFHKEVKRESSLLELYKKAPKLRDEELYERALDLTVSLTDSNIGFFHIISDDQKNIILTSWNNEAWNTCKASFKNHYPVEESGNWTDCIQAKRPIVYNDFKNSPNRKGFPKGHTPVKRFISTPVFDEDKVKFIFGVGNKIEEYDDHDVIQIQSVANELYRIIKQRHSAQALKEAHDNLEKEVKKRTYELEKSKEGFKALAENSPNIIIRVDKDLRYAYINPTVTEITGKSPEYYIGKTYKEAGIPEKIATNWKESNLKVFETGEVQHYEFEFLTINGLRFFESTIIPEFNVNNEIESLLVLSGDITERKIMENSLKESEEKYRELFNNVKDMITLSEIKANGMPGKYIEVNEVGVKRMGYSREEFLNLSPIDIVAPEYRAEMPKNAVVMAEKGSANFEIVQITKDGKRIPIEVNGHIINYKGRKTYLTVSRDITERKISEEKLKETIGELERSNQELQQFAYVSSHDLQEPLRTIASFTQLLERRYKGKFDSDADEFMDFIVEAAVRMKLQIEGLLEYSRVGTRGGEFEFVDLNEILNQTIENLNTSIKESNAEITFDELPRVMGDADQLQRVFLNLISNAIRFRKCEEPPIIHISFNKDIYNKEYLFSIEDNGIGIEEQYSERIFTIFQRLHTRDVYKGTGIGLSIVKRIIERHGGRVWVESSFGVGSTFYFTLPIK